MIKQFHVKVNTEPMKSKLGYLEVVGKNFILFDTFELTLWKFKLKLRIKIHFIQTTVYKQ